MKCRWIYIAFLCIRSVLTYSQGEGNIWYFGQNAGLDFNSGSPVALTNGQMSTIEGCATISNPYGQLLFYTDGVTVWNGNHQAMANGTGLMGHFSSSQSAVIVPKPGSPNLFYIFTTPEKADPIGARYSVVDLNLNSGLGDVTSVKNVLLQTPVCEKIAVVKKDNVDEYWVIFHGYNSNGFFAYTVSAAGIGSVPIVSNVGSNIYNYSNTGTGGEAIGYLKFSSNGKRLISCNAYYNSELFDFDTATGLVSNARTITTSANPCYGAEFSPSNDLLYLSGGGFNQPQLFQYDLTAVNIPASQQLIFNSYNSEGFGALQLAPDNKIYVAKLDRTSLTVINNPDTYGLGCNVQLNGVSLAAKMSKAGLPQFVQTTFRPFFTVEHMCLNSNTQFTLDTPIIPNSVLWNFGDTQTSTSLNPSHLYVNPGTYNVTVTLTTNNGSFTKNKQITIVPTPITANAIANLQICGSASTSFDLTQFNSSLLGTQSSSVFGVAYFNSLSDAVNHVNVLPSNYNLSSGTAIFYAKVYNRSNKECADITNFSVEFFVNPVANTPNDIFACDVNNDGVGLFNLQNASAEILGGQSTSQYLISYHLNQNDADANSNPLPLNYQNISNPQTIYARVETSSQALTCFATTSFQIGLDALPVANQPLDLFSCDSESDGIEMFDLAQQTSTILGTQSSTRFNVTYHASQSDADSNANALNQIFGNASNPQTIHARVESKSNASCFATTSFLLHLKPVPVLIMNDVYSNCEGNLITINAPSGFSGYNWSNGVTTQSNMISAAGNYTLTVTKDYGSIICSTTKSFEVYNSNIAAITNIEIKDWTDEQNMITVGVTGNGDYEYSLDGVHYQDSNVFTGLGMGQYTVFVNDKKGCGTVTDNVFLMMYPKFFTPNGDGINDIWRIKFSNAEPDMELRIFDRYGKMITIFTGLDFGWDGTFNGRLLYSDDYWFVVKRQNGKEFMGHFTLQR